MSGTWLVGLVAAAVVIAIEALVVRARSGPEQ
jgi:hypothetical protein